MGFLDRVKERISVSCLITDATSLKETIEKVKQNTKNIPKIPNVIHMNKKYDSFSVITELPSKAILLLVSGDDHEVEASEVILELNANYFSYSEILQKVIGKVHTPCSYETIGDIIHLNLTEGQLAYKKIIGEVLHFKTGCTVINKTGKIDSTHRNYEFEVLGGSGSLTTIHNENGIKIFLDLANVYWCSRLQTERASLLSKLRAGEVLCDPFCGVGPHILPALKNGLKVYANDINPSAVECIQKSLKLNKLKCDTLYCMDAREFLQSLKGERIDHFVFNLPEYSLDYIRFLYKFRNFTLHCYFFIRNGTDPIASVLNRTGLRISNEWLRHVRKVSPSKSVLKLEVSSKELFGHNQDIPPDGNW